MLKRSVAILASTAVLALLVAPSAQAKDPELKSYGAGASATALFLSLLDQDLTFSGTSAAVGSTPEAKANGQAVTTPLFSTPGAPVESEGALVSGEDCVLDEDLPSPINLAGLEISCVRTSAEVADDSPTGTSTSDEVVLDIISADLVGQVTDDVLRPLLEQLLAGLEPLLAMLGDLGPSLDLIIDLLLNDLSDGGALASITVAPTSSTATDVSSVATAQGVDVDLLPGLIPGAASLARVTVGDSFASAVYDPASDETTIDGKAAFLSVDLTGLEAILTGLIGGVGDAIVGQLPDPLPDLLEPIIASILELIAGLDEDIEDLVNVTIDQLACPDSPLAAILCFSAGGVNELDAAGLDSFGFTYGEGTRGVEAEILALDVLDGTLQLGVGQAAAGANAIPAPATPPTPPTPDDPDVPLPRTGGTPSLPIALALFAAAVSAMAIVRRTRTV